MKRETINSAVNHVLHHIIIEVCDVTERHRDIVTIVDNQKLVQSIDIVQSAVQHRQTQNITQTQTS